VLQADCSTRSQQTVASFGDRVRPAESAAGFRLRVSRLRRREGCPIAIQLHTNSGVGFAAELAGRSCGHTFATRNGRTPDRCRHVSEFDGSQHAQNSSSGQVDGTCGQSSRYTRARPSAALAARWSFRWRSCPTRDQSAGLVTGWSGAQTAAGCLQNTMGSLLVVRALVMMGFRYHASAPFSAGIRYRCAFCQRFNALCVTMVRIDFASCKSRRRWPEQRQGAALSCFERSIPVLAETPIQNLSASSDHGAGCRTG